MAQHVRQGLTETHAMLLYRAHDLCIAVEEFLLEKCGVRRAEAVGDYRRRVDVIEELAFIVETDNFPARGLQAGTLWRTHTTLDVYPQTRAVYALSSGSDLADSYGLTGELGPGARRATPAAKLTCANWPP